MNEPVRIDEHQRPGLPLDGPAPEDQLQFGVEELAGGQLVVRVGGDLDLLTAGMLRERLAPRLMAPAVSVVLDLTAVGFLGSAGLSELVSAKETASRNGVRFALVAVSRAVLRPLEITGLSTLFDVYDSVRAAREAAGQV